MKRKHIIIALILLCTAFVVHDMNKEDASGTRIATQTCTATEYSFVIPFEALTSPTTNLIASVHGISIWTRRPAGGENRPGSVTISSGRFISKSLLSKYFHIKPDIADSYLHSGDFPVSVGILRI
ncbi:MAG: hypothetical protein ACI3ZL_02670 [Candidatus Cryptobacteroides sp.]